MQYFTASKKYIYFNLEKEIKFQISNLFDDLYNIILIIIFILILSK